MNRIKPEILNLMCPCDFRQKGAETLNHDIIDIQGTYYHINDYRKQQI